MEREPRTLSRANDANAAADPMCQQVSRAPLGTLLPALLRWSAPFRSDSSAERAIDTRRPRAWQIDNGYMGRGMGMGLGLDD